MKSQRGNVYVILALSIAAGLVLWGLVAAWNAYTDGIDQKGYTRGVDETTAKYQERDNAALQAALAEVQRLQNKARDDEAAHAKALAAIGRQLKQEKVDAENKAARFTADLAAGRLVRRDDAFQGGGCTAVNSAGAAGPPAAGAGSGDGSAPCELSPAARGRVLAIGDAADDTARQLAACQAVIIEDRRLCGAPDSPRSNQP